MNALRLEACGGQAAQRQKYLDWFPLVLKLVTPLLLQWSAKVGRIPVLCLCCAAAVFESTPLATSRSWQVFGLTHIIGGLFCGHNAIEAHRIIDATADTDTRGRAFDWVFLTMESA